MSKQRDDAIFWGVIGVIVVVSALTGLGTAAGYWEVEFPFWPTMFVWIGFGIVVSSIRKLQNPEEEQNNGSKSWC
jgi:predicted tellurium resistance membrane protein TerC